jgi:hypothetical protein
MEYIVCFDSEIFAIDMAQQSRSFKTKMENMLFKVTIEDALFLFAKLSPSFKSSLA